MEALSSLNLSKNGLKGAEAGKALGDAIAASTVLKQLDISGSLYPRQQCDVEFLQAFGVGLGDNRAMMSLHVGMNDIPEKEMKEIITIAMRKDSMKIICEVPIKDKALTEFDISGKILGMAGALVVAEYLRDNRALTSLNLSSNNLEAKGAKIVAEAIKVTNCAIAAILAPFSCPSDHWLNCCCLLLSTG
jgi:Ran GTPase-activating protein (RanGAP) involved in mRNA processing and transport